MSCASSKIPDEASPFRYYMRKMHGNSEYNLIEQARHLGAVVHISVLLSSIRTRRKSYPASRKRKRGIYHVASLLQSQSLWSESSRLSVATGFLLLHYCMIFNSFH